MTARALNPGLFRVARQNTQANEPLFEAAGLDIVMQPARVIATRLLTLLVTPLLHEFLRHARHESNEWAQALLARLAPMVGQRTPEVWSVEVTSDGAPAVARALEEGDNVRIADLLRHPHAREESLSCLPLFLRRGEESRLVPSDDTALAPGDRLLFAGLKEEVNRMQWTLNSGRVLRYVQAGEVEPQGWIGRLLVRRAH